MTLKVSNFAKTYPDGTKALLPTELEVEQGEILSLLGPSGCGKTTLLRLIAGLETPDKGGDIFFDTDNVTALPVEKRAIGMVFQSYALFPNMSVRGNIGYGLKMQKLSTSEIAERVDHVLELCHLTPYADRSINALSGGQRQRVALARAVAPRPRILLLDEPLSALDAALRDELRDELALLLRMFGITAIFVTHDQDEALAIADRVAVMKDGVIAQVGSPEILYRKPSSAFVAEFVGNAMRLDGHFQDKKFKMQGGEIALPVQAQSKTSSTPDLYVRAEDVTLDQTGSLEGTVNSVTFLGTHYKIALSGIMEDALYCLHSGQTAPAIGETVSLSIDPSALLMLDPA
ncbi:ABC transporter ATP-binding protein [Cohaesibacter gelatinilyticus]|uniref:Putative spermidine/putrescine transport system ATP-binding protein n=1 Tax=Cohaesibacter gelatinilyticus TaxID=372072 RepID=A0A285PEN5_9HYPH|nr:ABC transporter ATP-binding protein [Cohaesibacter gelatinilyticus]SNZ20189.1 putative spermidine/putrescine transport system ATP-binding protein [Cohaesibacter gelatinilyticus]